MPNGAINPKVPAATGGGVGGYTLGKAIAILFIYYIIGDATPAHIKLAIEYIFEALSTIAGAALAGYYTRA